MTTSFWPLPTTTKTFSFRKWHLALLLCAVPIAIALSYTHDRTRVTVRVTSPTYQVIEGTISSSGTVTPVNDFAARASFSGVVNKIYVRLGQKVQAGQMLVLMKDQYALSRVLSASAALESSKMNEENIESNGSQEDRIGLNADLTRAQTERSAAVSAYSTLQELEARGSVSEAEVAAGKQRLQAADAALVALQQRTTSRYSPTDAASWKQRVFADKANLVAERVSYNNAHITSPVAGTVYLLPVTQYDFVSAGSVLLQVADLNKVHIRANFEEIDVGKLQIGEPVTITWEGKPNQSWKGRIVEKPLAVTRSDTSNVGQCTIGIDNPNGDLPVGSDVVVTVIVAKHDRALTIPREAMHTEGASQFVYRVKGDSLVRTAVNVGIVTPLRSEVTGGLQPTDEIALNRPDGHELTNNIAVTAAK